MWRCRPRERRAIVLSLLRHGISGIALAWRRLHPRWRSQRARLQPPDSPPEHDGPRGRDWYASVTSRGATLSQRPKRLLRASRLGGRPRHGDAGQRQPTPKPKPRSKHHGRLVGVVPRRPCQRCVLLRLQREPGLHAFHAACARRGERTRAMARRGPAITMDGIQRALPGGHG